MLAAHHQLTTQRMDTSLDMARKLLEAGMSLEDLKECKSNLAWAFEIVRKDFDAHTKKATANIYGDKE